MKNSKLQNLSEDKLATYIPTEAKVVIEVFVKVII